jgi:hypothetical protein
MPTRLKRYDIARTALGAAAAIAASLALGAQPASAAECPNEQFRTGPSAMLPDCRAYELVSPLGLEPSGEEAYGYAASVAGGRVAWYSKAGAPSGSVSYGPYFMSTRGSGGWSTQDVIPPQSTANGDFCYPSIDYSPDLSKAVLADGWNWGEGYPKLRGADNGSSNCSHDEPELVPGEPHGAQNLFLRDDETGSYQLVSLTPSELPARDAWFQAGSEDFSHVVFTSPLKLTADAPAPPENALYFRLPTYAEAEDLYEWVAGTLRLVTVLPNRERVWGLLVNGSETGRSGPTDVRITNAVSSDGERIFFYAGGQFPPKPGSEEHGLPYSGGNLYLRENAAQPAVGECETASAPCTAQIDAGVGPSLNPHFQWATPDGSRAFFTDEGKLTNDAKAESGKPDLYEYDLARPPGQRLTDLTAEAGTAAGVLGLSGISEDGSYVYFVAEGELASTANPLGERPTAGKPNLYVRHGGVTAFIARLNQFKEDPEEITFKGDYCDWSSFSPPGAEQIAQEREVGVSCLSARVTPDGRFLAFTSRRKLTGYDNVVQATGARDREIFVYDALNNTLHCASCAEEFAPTANPAEGEDPQIWRPTHEEQWYRTVGYADHQLANDGAVFFSTQSRLLKAAENGVSNVYEYNAGRLSLISSGKSADPSYFRDATPSGSDVYFMTSQALVGGDVDNRMSLYDARVDGGFAEPGATSSCGDTPSCRGAVAGLPGFLAPQSATFEGSGNLQPAPPAAGPAPKPPAMVCKKGFRVLRVHHRRVCRRVTGHRRRTGRRSSGRRRG